MSLTTLYSLSKDLDIFDTFRDYKENCLSMGLYSPLPVSGQFLIHGFSLIKKAESAGIKELSVVVLPEMGREELMTVALECEDRTGTYSWSEIERIISFIEEEKKPDRSLISLIQGYDDINFFNNYALYKNSTPFLKQCIDNHLLDVKTAHQVCTLPDKIFQLILAYKENNKISFSEIRILCTTLYEIAMRDRWDEQTLITMCETFLAHKDPVEAVKKIRFPELSALYEKFESFKQNTVKSRGITLREPPYFEGDSFTIEFNFQSKKQLHKKITVLQKLEDNADELFGLL